MKWGIKSRKGENVSAPTVDAALAEIERLRAAIRRHRDWRGDDRCWLDDLELYDILGETAVAETQFPPECEFLESCRRFWNQRQRPVDKCDLDPKQLTIRQLEDKVTEQAIVIVALESRLDAVRDALGEKV